MKVTTANPVENVLRENVVNAKRKPLAVLPYLPFDMYVRILRHCDEPTRDKAACVSKEFAAAVPAARRADYFEAAKRPGRLTRETLPTWTELAERGCFRPDHHKILALFGASFVPSAGHLPLHRQHQQAALLQSAQNEGLAATWPYRGGTYTGGGQSSIPHGFGIHIGHDSGRYEGEFQNGKRHGRGIYIWPDGTRYEGDFLNDTFHGYGQQIWPDGTRYEGQYQNNKRHGYGVSTIFNGICYKGEYKYGLRDGHGICTWPDGSCYDGDFKAGKLHGRGTITWLDGSRYEGNWREGEPVRRSRLTGRWVRA